MALPSPVAAFPDMSGLVQQNQARAASLTGAAWAQLQNSAAEQKQKGNAARLQQASMQYMDGMEPPGYAGGLSNYGQAPSQGGQISPAQVPQGEMAGRIRQGLISRGMPEHIADGFLMNFQDESGLNPGINEQNPLVEGSRGGFGLYQLTGPRRVAFENFAQQRGTSYDDVDAQLDFLMGELDGSESRAAQQIFGAETAGQAGALIVEHFLRPAEEHMVSRRNRYLGRSSRPQGRPARSAPATSPRPTARDPYATSIVNFSAPRSN